MFQLKAIIAASLLIGATAAGTYVVTVNTIVTCEVSALPLDPVHLHNEWVRAKEPTPGKGANF